MYINKVISFRNSWNKLISEYDDIYSELNKIVLEIDIYEISRNSDETRYRNSFIQNFRRNIEKNFDKYQWKNFDSRIDNMFIHIGKYKKNISCKFISNNDLLNRLIYTYSLLAYKNKDIDLSILLILDKSIISKYTDSVLFANSFNYEKILKEFQALQPLGHNAPFLILNLTDEKTINIEVAELVAENERKDENIIINRCIEFPAHLKQAGLGILTYFGTIIEQKYPEHNSKVSIEQDGNLVRLVIETESGEKEIIEKVLEEYTLVVTNQKAPEDFLDDKLKIIELKNELNIANARMESSLMLISHKDNTIKDLNNILINMSKKEHNITINNNNYLESKNEFIINFPEIISNFKDFVLESQKFPELEMKILDLNESLENLENKKDPEKIKNSTALKKLNEFLNSSIEKGTKIEEFISTVENGYEKVKNIGKKYNSVAKWCGAPIIPFFE
ncbi:hypothetical protein [Aliarcobacter butzleri]|uniref:hypothetical protein n=1 Tax=Aliarcobacter butzleri TaxID=28197 RepID=UPI0002295B8F|nr:hypothetical protein [Aliarcobacter butzleri]BAK70887.1 hypothetical protein ABED_1170 [Aliarcobacter butzleri ED-1]